MMTLPWRKAARPLLVTVFALAINGLLFATIEFMVRLGQVNLTDASDVEIANFIRMQEPTREVRSRRDAKAPEKPASEMQQDIQRLSQVTEGAGTSDLVLSLPEVNIDIGLGVVGGDIEIARELTPLVRMPADYPPGALARGLEGYVVLRFTVTETGAVADPEVLIAEPPDIFDSAAMRAVLRWKYQPRFAEGVPVKVVTYTRIVFRIDRNQTTAEEE